MESTNKIARTGEMELTVDSLETKLKSLVDRFKKDFQLISHNFELELQCVISEVDSRILECTEWTDTHNSLVRKIQMSFEKSQKIINLNVGGKVFSTTKEVLMSFENTYFYALMANIDHFKPSEDGTFFIDRDPIVFDRILNYMRNGQLDIRDLKAYKMNILKSDIDYYSMPIPKELQSMSTIPKDEVDEEGLDESDVYHKDIALVVDQAHCTRAQAIAALRNNNNDLVYTILELTA